MPTPITILDVQREVRAAVSRIRIIESTSIHVLPGDHPMQPSIIVAPPGGFVEGPSSSTDNAMALWDGPTGDLLKDSTVTWDGSVLQLGEVSGGTNVTIKTALHFSGVSGDLKLTTGGGISVPGIIDIRPAGSVGSNTGVTATFAGGRGGGTGQGGIAQIIGGPGQTEADGGEVWIDGGPAVGMGDKGNVVIQGNLIIFPNGGMSTPVSFDTPLITTDELGDSGSGEVTMLSDLDLNGFDLVNLQVVAGVMFDGGGGTIAVGTEVELRVDQGFTITGWYMLADAVGSIKIDVWKDTFANYPPTNADTITGGNEPELSFERKGSDFTLTGWNTTVVTGDILKFRVDSSSFVERVSLYLVGSRT